VYDKHVGSQNPLNPLDELRALGQQLEQATDRATLKPIFHRLDELARVHSGDLDVQLAVTELKQRVLEKGLELKQREPVAPVVAAPMAMAPVEPEEEVAHVMVEPSPVPEERKSHRGPIVTAIIAGTILGVLVFAVIYNMRLAKQSDATVPVAVKITTTPSGATVLRDGEALCTSDCDVQMIPGMHKIEVQLEGYETVTREAFVLAGKALALEFPLAQQKPAVRIYADLAQGKVTLDGQQAGTLEGGQLMLDAIEPGTHTLAVTGGGSSATVTFTLEAGHPPVMSEPMKTKDVLAVVVASMGKQGRVATSAGPLKLQMNGQAQGDAGPAGVDLTGFQPGAAELVVGEGTTARTMQERFSAAPALTVFLKSDQNIGTLVVATNQDDARVFVNGKEQPKRTQRGQVRVSTLGKTTVRVEKKGFEDPEAKTVTVAKGAEVRVSFTLRPLPEFAVLVINDGVPGAEVWVDQRQIGSVGADGHFLNSSIDPGDRVIEMRREQFESKRYARTFPAGRPVTIAGADAGLTAIRVTPPPPPPPVVVEAPKPEPSPPPKVVAAPKPVVGTMAQFDSPGSWKEQDGVFRRKGGGTFTYSLVPNGVFTFTIHLLKGGNLFRGARVRWVAQYVNARNYVLYEMDNESLWAKVVEDGKTFERRRVATMTNKDLKNWTMQVELSPREAVVRIQRGGEWVVLDSWSEPGRDFTKGKFGILVNGDDEVGLSEFKFVGR